MTHTAILSCGGSRLAPAFERVCVTVWQPCQGCPDECPAALHNCPQSLLNTHNLLRLHMLPVDTHTELQACRSSADLVLLFFTAPWQVRHSGIPRCLGPSQPLASRPELAAQPHTSTATAQTCAVRAVVTGVTCARCCSPSLRHWSPALRRCRQRIGGMLCVLVQPHGSTFLRLRRMCHNAQPDDGMCVLPPLPAGAVLQRGR